MTTSSATGNTKPEAPPSPTRVLLAEDDFELRELLASVLRADGYEVTEACDGNELWALLVQEPGAGVERAPFSLVVSDLRMPGLSAFDVLSSAQRRLTEIPVILITAFGDESTHLRALRLGAKRVLDKPFDCDELRDAVQAALCERAHPAS